MKRQKKPIIALAQIKYYDTSKESNVEKIKKFIRLAKKKNADIVCFPESCVHKTIFFSKNHKLINEIKEECKKNKIWCIITEDLKIRKKLYNTALLIDRKGKIKGHYKKIHLYGDKTKAGEEIRVFKTDFAKIGIAICWDLAFPNLFQKMKKNNAQIIFCPAQWWYDTGAHKKDHQKHELKILESLVRTRAYENVCYLAICNPVVKSKQQISYTAIASPTRILSQIVKKEGLITAKINLNEIKRIEKIYKT